MRLTINAREINCTGQETSARDDGEGWKGRGGDTQMIHENCLIFLSLTHVLDFRERGLFLYLSLSVAALPAEEISLSNCQESPIFDA